MWIKSLPSIKESFLGLENHVKLRCTLQGSHFQSLSNVSFWILCPSSTQPFLFKGFLPSLPGFTPSQAIFICKGCYNKVSQTGWLKQQKFTVLKIRVLLGCLVRPLFWACRQLSYRCIAYNPSSVHTEEEKCLVSLPLLIRTWVKKSQTWQLNKNIISLTALSPTTVTEKVSISTYKLGTEDRIQTLTR